MQIACQKCGATYETDERLLSSLGVRAQCPSCKHQQAVGGEPADQASPRSGSVSALLRAGARPRSTPSRGLPGGAPLDTDAAPRRSTPSPFEAVAEPDEESSAAPAGAGGARPRTHSRPHGTPAATASGPARTMSGSEIMATQGIAMTASGSPAWVKPVALAVAALVVLGGGAVAARAILMRDEEEVPAAIQDVLPRWRLEFTDLQGSASELLAEGRKRLAEDRPTAYRDAEESFQRALLLDPRSDEAVAGYGLALGLGRGETLDEETQREALDMVRAARQRGGETAAELLAEAHLLMARAPDGEKLQNARQLLQRALSLAIEQEKGDVYLALGRSFLLTSVELAVQNLDQALGAMFPPPRAHYYRGLAHASVGEFRKGIADLERRLQLDPGHSETLEALAGIYEELGSPEDAREVYLRAQRADPEDVRIQIQLAVLMYQFEGRAREAAAALRDILRDEDRLEREVVVDGYVHLAAAERAVGNADGAAAAGSRALLVSKDDAAAHLQLLRVAFLRNRPDEAAAHLPYLRGHLDDPALEHVVAGRVAMAQGRHEDAVRELSLAAEKDARRVDALLGAGVAAARAGHPREAQALLFKAVHGDPTRSAPRRPMTRFWLAEGETLEGLEGTVLSMASSSADVMPLVYEGLIRFHQGATADADRLFARVLAEDETNALALSFRALLAVKRGEPAQALRFAQRAALSGTRVTLSHYAYGMALAAHGDVDEAKRQLREASNLSPSLLASEVRLAELEARKPAELAAARARLVRCLALDPTYVAAKRALYSLERREAAAP